MLQVEMDQPLSPEVFRFFLSDLTLSKKIAVAVSGGADSLTLCLLLHEYAIANKIELWAFTCDHGLRPESAKEAQWVNNFCALRNISHDILVLEGPKPKSGIQEWARDARYKAIEAACFEKGISQLFLGHHQEDQIETFLIRLRAGSTFYGLSSMAKIKPGTFTTYLRPLLDVSKSSLIKTLMRFGVTEWIEDPSNNNLTFERVRIRHKILPFLTLDLRKYILKTIKDCAYYRSEIDTKVDYLYQQKLKFQKTGSAIVAPDVLEEKEEILIPFFQKLLHQIGGKKEPIKHQKIRALIEGLKERKPKQTLSYCLITPHIRIEREHRFLPPPRIISGKGWLLWDNRFLIHYTLPKGHFCVVPYKKAISKKTTDTAFFAFPVLQGLDDFAVSPQLWYIEEEVFFKVDFLPNIQKAQKIEKE